MLTLIFVCHGNICRSPAAEYIAKDIINKRGLDKGFRIISRALSYEEISHDIYPPMKDELNAFHIPFDHHHAQIINQNDYEKADYIFYMDDDNYYRINRLINDYKHIVKPIYLYDDNIKEIEDPWYSGRYHLVVSQLIRCINEIFDNLLK